MTGTLTNTALLSGLLVNIGVQVVVVHVLGGVLANDGIEWVRTSVVNVEPAGLGLVSEEQVAAVLPLEPFVDLLGKEPDVLSGLLVNPVGHGALKERGVLRHLSGELVLEHGECVIEGQGVGRHVNPAGVVGKHSHGLTGPETAGRPRNIGGLLLRVLAHSFNVEGPGRSAVKGQVLLKNAVPLGAGNVLIKGLEDVLALHVGNGEAGSEPNVADQLLVGLVVTVLEGTTLKVDNTGEPVHVVNSGLGSDLGTEAVTADSGHGDLIFVHEADNVLTHLVEAVAVVVVGAALVPVVEEPDIADLSDLVVRAGEELVEVLSRLDEFGQPNHGGHVSELAWNVSAAELDGFSAGRLHFREHAGGDGGREPVLPHNLS